MVSKKQKTFGGFSSARDVLKDCNRPEVWTPPSEHPIKTSHKHHTEDENDENNASTAIKSNPSDCTATTNSTAPSDPNRAPVVLLVRGIAYHKENINSSSNSLLDTVTLQREPENKFDGNAMKVLNGNQKMVGYVAKEQADILSPLLDEKVIELDIISHKVQFDKVLLVVNVVLLDYSRRDAFNAIVVDSKLLGKYSHHEGASQNFSIITQQVVEDLSFGITKQDHQNACECKFDVLQTKSLPWKLESDGTTSQWPPSNDFLTSFGYGNAGDEQWWEENTGLEPPSLWNVSGALDLLPTLSMSSIQKQRACSVLDEAIHGVTSVWSDATLEQVRTLMHSERLLVPPRSRCLHSCLWWRIRPRAEGGQVKANQGIASQSSHGEAVPRAQHCVHCRPRGEASRTWFQHLDLWIESSSFWIPLPPRCNRFVKGQECTTSSSSASCYDCVLREAGSR
eukprot:g9313.t1 g9313   contig36:316476-318015(+)